MDVRSKLKAFRAAVVQPPRGMLTARANKEKKYGLEHEAMNSFQKAVSSQLKQTSSPIQSEQSMR